MLSNGEVNKKKWDNVLGEGDALFSQLQESHIIFCDRDNMQSFFNPLWPCLF